MWIPSFAGGDSRPNEHQGSVSSSWILIQVSNDLSQKTNGKVQLSQPVVVGGYVGGSVVAVQTATNPVPLNIDLNVTVSVLVLLIKLHGWEIDPQCLVKLSSCTQPSSHVPVQ